MKTIDELYPNSDLTQWPFCSVPGCEFCICLWAGTGKCYPHSVENLGETEMNARYLQTHSRILLYEND